MTSSGDRVYAVLTGDLIKSTDLSPSELAAAREHLLKETRTIKSWDQGLVKSRSEFFRGDSWQLLLSDASKSLRAAFFLRASLLAHCKVATRISIGIGDVELIAPRRVSLSTGQAFTRSGIGLDHLTQSSMTIEFATENTLIADLFALVCRLCDSLSRDWTQRQAEIVSLALAPAEPTHEKIALQLSPPITKQAVTKTLNAAHWRDLHAAIRMFENTDWNHLKIHPAPPDNL